MGGVGGGELREVGLPSHLMVTQHSRPCSTLGSGLEALLLAATAAVAVALVLAGLVRLVLGFERAALERELLREPGIGGRGEVRRRWEEGVREMQVVRFVRL